MNPQNLIFWKKLKNSRKKKVELVGFKIIPNDGSDFLECLNTAGNSFYGIEKTKESLLIDCNNPIMRNTRLMISDKGLLLWQEFPKGNVLTSSNPDARGIYLLFDSKNNSFAAACEQGLVNARLERGVLVIPISSD